MPVRRPLGPAADVEEHEIPVLVRTRCTAQRPVGHGDEGVCPIDTGRDGLAHAFVLAGAEQLVASSDKRPLDDCPFIGRKLRGELPRASPAGCRHPSPGPTSSFRPASSPAAAARCAFLVVNPAFLAGAFKASPQRTRRPGMLPGLTEGSLR